MSSPTLTDTTEESALLNGSTVPRELLFKFLVIGDYGVGKTAIVRRYTEAQQPDVGQGLPSGCRHRAELTGVVGVAAAVVFDVSRTQTFQSVSKWLSDLREKVTLHDGTPVPVVLLANKCDIQGIDIATETMAKFCSENGIAAWFVTSAKENVNIDEAMRFLVDKVIHFKAQESNTDAIILKESSEQDSKLKPSCCG
ncbi:Ras-related protein Rab-32 [Blattella germanica]|nr:Ras-related protein Rab-32 [Blattella germanica]